MEIIRDTLCPKCKEEALTYNGNYFCTNCDWIMPSRHTAAHKEIMRKYMTQKRDEYTKKKDVESAARMNFYLRRL